MERVYRKGAIGALLDEYEKAIGEFKLCIRNIADDKLAVIVDPDTDDMNCRSVQTILTHVVHAAYGYAVFIRKLKEPGITRPDKKPLPSVMIIQRHWMKRFCSRQRCSNL